MLRHGRSGWRSRCIGRMRPNGLASGDRRQCETSSERSAAARVLIPSGARGPAVAYAAERKTMFRKATLAQRKEQRHVRRSPVRVRHVDQWIAQTGRASDSDSDCRGFDSRSKTAFHAVSDTGDASPHPETPLAALRTKPRSGAAEDGTPQRRRRRTRAHEATDRGGWPDATEHRRAPTPPRFPRRARTGSAPTPSGALPPHSASRSPPARGRGTHAARDERSGHAPPLTTGSKPAEH